ncbi:uncharacterized protein ASPGLDRAFT_1081328 [Aspergillus glaucus CBS 516.65]|uniref:Uncharacterized protein n=1 Tax=Aspergillus glaucus CBS 516.65 TaxID=1160497 RepID=A0A1L9V519_ASPGL|nr:hypothetical protein ASPGLDRAFT_1081328 [Aspergillus glaucus CBS 516.65]OJJ78932.1 hypothetical protein ASPGLDRAFT_1081328 [Aspergillus glaucus CBS 516.65]
MQWRHCNHNWTEYPALRSTADPYSYHIAANMFLASPVVYWRWQSVLCTKTLGVIRRLGVLGAWN